MNRIVLKVNLLENNGLQIDLFHLDKRFISDGSEFMNFYTSDYEFMIYSKGEMYIGNNSFRVPDINNYKEKQTITHTFDTENKRYEFLKGLYNCLLDWNDHYTPFTKDSDHKQRNRHMILSGEFWVI